MTTNGTLLRDLAVPLKHAGLHRLNISLDALDPAHYREITRGGDVRLVLEGIEAARAAGFASIKINCVVNESGDEPDARAVAAFAREHGFPIRFIRRMVLESGAFWKVEGGEGGDCGRCNRLRMTSDGRLIPCLFNDLSFSVRELGVEKALRAAIAHKPPRGGQSRYCIGTLGG